MRSSETTQEGNPCAKTADHIFITYQSWLKTVSSCCFNLNRAQSRSSVSVRLTAHICLWGHFFPPFLCVYLSLFCLIFSISSSCPSPSFLSCGDLSPPTSSENTGTAKHSITLPFPLLFLFFFPLSAWLPFTECSSAILTWELAQPCNAIVTVGSVRSFPSPTLEML